MRTLLITGLLGSGKSTVLLSLAAYLGRKAGPRAVVIVENEIGDMPQEASCPMPAKGGTSPSPSRPASVEMTNDCICCTLTGELVGLLEEIKTSYNPSWLIVEASSLAHQSIKDIIHQTLNIFEPLSILVVDAGRWRETYEEVPMLVGTQATRADLILVTKADTVPAAELGHVLGELRRLNPSCPIRPIDPRTDDLSGIWADLVAEAEGFEPFQAQG
ncbi:MAG: hypothetical protein LBF40_02200 [Deltaproteobacteria bacterium]|jgi:G3E family GTPase|nr:hypothetical protein [Deltaproteobacteria bacterium]